jgi:hypothetical protein
LPEATIDDARSAPSLLPAWATRHERAMIQFKLVPEARVRATDDKITAADVWEVLQAAEERCEHCRSLALEQRPSGPGGRPALWASVARRIGSLGHRLARVNGGSNQTMNLYWS